MHSACALNIDHVAIPAPTVHQRRVDLSGYKFRSEMFKRQLAEEVEKAVAKARADDVLLILSARNITVNDAVRAKILACTESAHLERWLRHAVTATCAEDIVAEWEPLPPARAVAR
ncbi:hypothetical protein LVJ94_17590 [Pendulispora rubella]|uniref:Uncharacterized protein n=1 Tax=Pendulispora rubella TaxID=2741070 RepID=A0ABZ2LDL7_9BACT